jgi:hypothetical protein
MGEYIAVAADTENFYYMWGDNRNTLVTAAFPNGRPDPDVFFEVEQIEELDTDNDGIPDSVDPDDDNDGQSDDDEIACGSDPLDASNTSPDADGDNIPDCVDPDADGDLVDDSVDICPATVIPEAAPTSTAGLNRNRWALQNTNGIFTQAPPQAGSVFSFTTADTRGCSCEQIVVAAGLGKNHLSRGCSTSAMLNWIANP